jgi:predicted NBD/HSP70 family sugar kinase
MLEQTVISEAPRQLRGSNHVGMRQFNERVVLEAVRLHGALPKAELARQTGLSAQTVGLITARLLDDDLLMRQRPLRGRIGQPSVPLALNPDGAFSIGIKIGRRSTDCLLVDFAGKVRTRVAITYPFPDADALLPQVERQIKRLANTLGDARNRLVGVGVAAPFRMGGWHSLLGLSEAQSSRWNALDTAAAVQALTTLPVSFARDTAAACVAELVAGRGRDLKSFLYIFVDTFVGGGLVLNSQLHTGIRGNAGAIASVPLSVATVNHIPEQLVSAASLWELEQSFKAIGIDPSAAYDERALAPGWAVLTQAWIDKASLALAHCIVAGTAFVDVGAVVLDGAMAPALLERLNVATREALTAYSWEGLWPPTIYRGTVGSDARALGGALLPLQENFAADQNVFLKAG